MKVPTYDQPHDYKEMQNTRLTSMCSQLDPCSRRIALEDGAFFMPSGLAINVEGKELARIAPGKPLLVWNGTFDKHVQDVHTPHGNNEDNTFKLFIRVPCVDQSCTAIDLRLCIDILKDEELPVLDAFDDEILFEMDSGISAVRPDIILGSIHNLSPKSIANMHGFGDADIGGLDDVYDVREVGVRLIHLLLRNMNVVDITIINANEYGTAWTPFLPPTSNDDNIDDIPSDGGAGRHFSTRVVKDASIPGEGAHRIAMFERRQ